MRADTIAVSVLVWLVNYTLQSTLIFGVISLVTRALPERFDSIADSLWKCALVTSVMSPLLPAPAIVRTSSPGLPFVNSLAASGGIGASSSQLSPAVILVAIWVAIAVAGLARLAIAYRGVLGTIRDRRPLTPAELKSHFGPARPSATVTCSASLQIPVAIGREICIPVWALEQLEPEQIRTVTAHEAAHIIRRDAAWRWSAVIMARIFFFQPFNRLAARKLRELAECLCDEAAVTQTGSASALASTLAAVAAVIARPDQRHLTLLPSFASQDSLTVRRVRRMLSARMAAAHTNPLVRVNGLMTAAASGVLLALGAVAPGFSSSRVPAFPYVITAADPAGPFTLTLNRGRVIGATISGRALAPGQVKQRGNSLDLVDPRSGTFSVELTPQGGITWMPRRPAANTNNN